MLSKKTFDRSTLPSGPVKILTQEELTRSEVRAPGKKAIPLYWGLNPKSARRDADFASILKVEESHGFHAGLGLRTSHENPVRNLASAPGGIEGAGGVLCNPQKGITVSPGDAPPQHESVPLFPSAAATPNIGNEESQDIGALFPISVAVPTISNGMRAPVIGPERPALWPRPMAELGVLPFAPPSLLPTLGQVVILAERYGLCVGRQKGFVASLRRHLASSMQAPGAKNTSEYYMAPFLENIPLSTLTSMLEQKYWTQTGSLEPSGIGDVGVVTFKTASPASIGKLFKMETCRPYAIDCGKLVLPEKVVESVYMLIAQPPGEIVHRTRPDMSFVIEAHFNFATLNEVICCAATCLLQPMLHLVPAPPPPHTVTCISVCVYSTERSHAALHTKKGSSHDRLRWLRGCFRSGDDEARPEDAEKAGRQVSDSCVQGTA